MKLGKEEFQKIFLSVLLLIGLLYCYFTMLLGPLAKQQNDDDKTVKDLTPKINDAKALIKEVAAREKNADQVSQTLEQIKSSIPDGAPVAWFPPSMIAFFKGQGIDKCVVHTGGEIGGKDLAGFKKLSCNLSVPRVEAVPLAAAIAALENDRPLMEIDTLNISALKENVQYQSASLGVTVIVNQ